MSRYREWYPNLSVITRVCSSSSDSSGSTVVREVWHADRSFTGQDGHLVGVRQSWGSVKANLHNGPARLLHGSGARGRCGSGPRGRMQNSSMDVSLMNGQFGTAKQRFIPYRRPSWRGEGQVEMIGEGNKQRFRVGDEKKGGKQWFKMTLCFLQLLDASRVPLKQPIPHGKKYDKRWLLTSLQNLCPIAFTPLHYTTEGDKVHFYLEDTTTASALSKLSRRILDSDGQRVVVLMNSCYFPPFLKSELRLEDLELLKLCLSKRFDDSQKSLDLTSIRTDPELVSHNVDIILNRKNCMQAVIKIIQESIPELLSLNLSKNKLYKLDGLTELVNKAPNLQSLNLSCNELKSHCELDKVKGFRLVELCLDGNPLCDRFKDQTTYISAVQKCFPRLLRLDGHVLSLPICFEVETSSNIPLCKGSHFVSNEIQGLIQRFLEQYYSIYDSGDRQPLLEAYHESACFSLCLPSISNPSRYKLDYFKNSRNVKNIKDSPTRFRLLKHTRLTVVACLNELPKTQHDINSINVDVNAYASTLLAFTVSGVFKEVDDQSEDLFKAFSRVFVTVPAQNSGLCIVNDELFVRNTTMEEIQCAFTTPTQSPSSSPVPILSAYQQEMLSAFSQMSEMNLQWSQKCLEDNAWDFQQAAQIFAELQAHGMIPEAAFIK